MGRVDRTASSRRIIQPLKSSDIILLLHTFHLSREDSATSQHNFSFHYSVGCSHACKVAGLVISTCQLLPELPRLSNAVIGGQMK